MRKKMANNKVSVRIETPRPSPFIRNNLRLLIPKNCDKKSVLDIGCGNGRNMNYLGKYASVCVGVDINPTYPNSVYSDVGKDYLPIPYMGWDLILVNYVFMFLDAKERRHLITEIQRVSSDICKIVVELYPAQNSKIKNDEEMIKLQNYLMKKLGWEILKSNKGRFIAQK